MGGEEGRGGERKGKGEGEGRSSFMRYVQICNQIIRYLSFKQNKVNAYRYGLHLRTQTVVCGRCQSFKQITMQGILLSYEFWSVGVGYYNVLGNVLGNVVACLDIA